MRQTIVTMSGPVIGRGSMTSGRPTAERRRSTARAGGVASASSTASKQRKKTTKARRKRRRRLAGSGVAGLFALVLLLFVAALAVAGGAFDRVLALARKSILELEGVLGGTKS